MLVSPRIQFTDAFPYASPHRGTVSYGYPAAFSVVFFKTNSCVCCVRIYLYIVLSMIHLSRVSSERRKRRRCVERKRERERERRRQLKTRLAHRYIYISTRQSTHLLPPRERFEPWTEIIPKARPSNKLKRETKSCCSPLFDWRVMCCSRSSLAIRVSDE